MVPLTNAETRKRYRLRHPDRIKEQSDTQNEKMRQNGYSREWFRILRYQTVQILGGVCVRCGFSDIRALEIDHVDGGGNQERKILGNSKILKKLLVERQGINCYVQTVIVSKLKRIENTKGEWSKFH